MYRYADSLDAPKKWFKANVDSIMKIFGTKHQIQKEDLFLGMDFLQLYGGVSSFMSSTISNRNPRFPRLCSLRQS
jgi:hypothetical protein